MKNDSKTPHLGMIVTLGAIIVAIWMLAIYGTIQEEHEKRYDVTVRPGAVSYGTHSSATIPTVSAPARHTSAPMISGNAVRSYAHYGHASYAHNPSPVTAIYTTSSATVHTIGSGGGASGGGAMTSGGQGTSSRGVAYGGASVSMPTFALVTPMYSSLAGTEALARYGVGPRKAKPVDDGEYDGEQVTDTEDPSITWTWNEDDLEWYSSVPLGTTRYDDALGYMVVWTDHGWVKLEDQGEPGNDTPLGDAPWLWMFLLALSYGVVKVIRRKHVFLPKVKHRFGQKTDKRFKIL